MNNCIDLLFCKYMAKLIPACTVDLVERRGLTSNFCDIAHSRVVCIIQIVSNDDFVACIQQFHSGMAADIAGATGNKDIHNLYLPIYIADEAVKSCLAIHISLIDTSMLQYLGKHLASFQLQNACGIVRCKRMGFL